MKTMVLTAPGRLEPGERPDPALRGDHEVLLRVQSVGICGSDVHYYREGRIGTQVVRYPFILGHECSATVVRTGARVENLPEHALVAVEPAVSCGVCDQCLAGRPHTCRRLLFLACPGQIEGCLCEYLVMPRENCFEVPREVTTQAAALIEPLAIGCYAVRLGPDPEGKAVGVWGSGPIGLSVMLALRSSPVRTLLAAEPLAPRRALALAFGASWSADPYATEFESEALAQAPGEIDIAFECCGKPEAIDQALGLLKPGGTLVLVGIPSGSRIALDIDRVRRKEIRFLNVRRQNGCVPAALALLQRERALAERMVTHRFPFDRTGEAFAMVSRYEDGVIKAIVDVSESHA